MTDPQTPTTPEEPSSSRPSKTCYQRAVDLLARRAHFSTELRFKLVRRDFDELEIDAAMERLQDEGYVDDDATARLWIEQQLARKAQGPSKLLAGLLRRGVDGDTARDAVREATRGNELGLAEEAARRHLTRSGKIGRAALARRLDRLGFNASVVARTLRRLSDELSP